VAQNKLKTNNRKTRKSAV